MKVVALLALFVCAVSAKSMNVGTFRYDSCDTSAPIQVTALSVTPDPINIPGEVTISITVSGIQDVTSPTDFHVYIQRNVSGSWVDLPCLGSIGSCDYPDVCANLNTRFPNGANCPEAITASGLNCNCPITAGTYTINNLVVDVTQTFPDAITGDYHVKVTAAEEGEQIACLDIYASLLVDA